MRSRTAWMRRNASSRTAMITALGLTALGLAPLTGCGTALEDALGGLLPDASSLTQEVKTACDGVMTEDEMVTSLVAARIDQTSGYTKEEELLNVATNCALDALFSGVPAADCTACKTTILDQVYGD